MNAPGPESLNWSRGRWWGTILLVAGVQVAVVYLLGDRGEMVPRRAGSASAFTLLSHPPPGGAVGDLVQLEDPTLFALADARGFSGRAWLVPQSLTPPDSAWREPESWLTQSVAELGGALDEMGKRNRLRYRTFDERPSPGLSRVTAPPLPLPERSTVQAVAGGRRLLALPGVPSITHADVLADTIVQIGITPEGFAFSSVVLNSSGSMAADNLALEAARLARFAPLSSRDPLAVSWGVLTFRWHTLPAPATNAPPGETSP